MLKKLKIYEFTEVLQVVSFINTHPDIRDCFRGKHLSIYKWNAK
jgi:hypothetical protein